MRRFALLAVAACSHPPGEPPFVGIGGTMAIASCGYSVTTKYGAEAPRAAGSTFGSDPTVRAVHLGYIGDPRTTAVAQWRTTDEETTASLVRYAAGANLASDQLTEQATGIEFRFGAQGAYRQHQAHLCGLLPGTAYSYQVGGIDGHGHAYLSPVYTFQTAPDVTANPAADVVLAFLGDSRGGEDVLGQLATLLQQHAPDLILFSGDAVTLALAQVEWDTWLDAAAPLLATTPIVLADGNHEANAVNFYSQFAMPGDQENFGVDYGFAHITIGNDTPEDPTTLTTSTLDAIRADFAASASARWKLFMHHRPMWSAGMSPCGGSTVCGSDPTLQASWGPVVDQYGIDLVLNGHEHQYEISKPLDGGTVQATNATGTVYVVAGGAGAELYPVGTGFWTAYSEETYSASIIDVRRDQLTLDSYRPDGTAITPGFSKTKP